MFVTESILLVVLIVLVVVVWMLHARSASSQRMLSSSALAALNHFASVISNANNQDELLADALDAILEISRAAAARIWLADLEKRTLQFRLHRGLYPATFLEPTPLPFGVGAIGRAGELKRTIHLNDLESLPSLREKGFVEFAAIPLVIQDRLVGVLDIAARHSGRLKTPTLQLIETSGAMLALAIEKMNQSARFEQREAETQQMWQAGLEIADSQDYPQVLRSVVDHARELIGAEASALCLWDAQKRWWVVQGTSGNTDAFEVSVKRFAPREGAPQVECPVIRFKYRQSHLDVPIMHEGQIVGCLCIANQQTRDFSIHERELLTGIADQAARAIETGRRLEFAGSRAATTERERLAREMHDTLAQLLGFVGFKSQAAREFFRQGNLEQAQMQLDQLTTLSQELYADTRELILGLRTQASPMQGLIPAISSYIEWFEQLSGIETFLESENFQDVRFSPTAELQIIRVIQEALSNVRKHSRGRNAYVRLERAEEFANIAIVDNGKGFDPTNIPRGDLPRFGLQSMRERVESIGGTLTIQSTRDHGATVTLRIPLVYRGE